MDIPTTIPTYIPTAPHPKTNANSAENITSRMNALKMVTANALVPFPIDWNRFPAMIPNGMNKRKNDRICRASTTFGAKTALSEEYEKMNDNGSAKMNKSEHITIEEINPNCSP